MAATLTATQQLALEALQQFPWKWSSRTEAMDLVISAGVAVSKSAAANVIGQLIAKRVVVTDFQRRREVLAPEYQPAPLKHMPTVPCTEDDGFH